MKKKSIYNYILIHAYKKRTLHKKYFFVLIDKTES